MPSELVVGMLTIISGFFIACKDNTVVMTTEPRHFLPPTQCKTVSYTLIEPIRMVHLAGKSAAAEEGPDCKMLHAREAFADSSAAGAGRNWCR